MKSYFIFDQIQSTMTAPMVAVPISLNHPGSHVIPNNLNTQLPTIPPTIPKNKLIQQPFPEPEVNLLAMKPAIIPTIIEPINPIIVII